LVALKDLAVTATAPSK
jgi:hypothetical protein